MANFLPPVVDYAPHLNLEPTQSQLLENLPFENQDADLFSFLDNLGQGMPGAPSTEGQAAGSGSGKGPAADRAAKADLLAGIPSWGLPNSDGAMSMASLSGTAGQNGLLGDPAVSATPAQNGGALPAFPSNPGAQLLQSQPGMLEPATQPWGMQQDFAAPMALAGYQNLLINSFTEGLPGGNTAAFSTAPAQPPGRTDSGGSSGTPHDSHEKEKEHRSPVPKAEAWKEKNRQAQRAFRQRQKEKQKASQQQIEELSEQVNALMLEKRQLEKALERANADKAQGLGSRTASLDDEEVLLVLRCGDAAPRLELTRGQLCTMTLERLTEIWKMFIHQMGALLPEADRNPTGTIAKRVEGLSYEARLLLWSLIDNNIRVLSAFMRSNLEDLGSPRVADPGMWSSILKRMALSPKQLQALTQTRRRLLTDIGTLLAEREQLAATIRGIEDVEDTAEGACMRYLDIADLIERVRANVDAIHVCKSYYMSHAYREILTPMQCARFMVFSFPFAADLLSLMTCAAKEAGDPSTHELLRTAAAAKLAGAPDAGPSRARCAPPASYAAP